MNSDHLPKYPIYIISKGRSESRLTSKALEEMNIPYYVAIEPQDFDDYTKVIDESKLIVLPFGNHGKGPGYARNFCWEHSIANGDKRHWVLDDNIINFMRLNHNKRIKVTTPAFFRVQEDFVDRYDNVYLAGPAYRFNCSPNKKWAPYVKNTRIYSCLLIQNDIDYRWEGRYNEDTDLSLRVLKDGHCTIQFNIFMQNKSNTGVMKGGNTAEFYAPERDNIDATTAKQTGQDFGGTKLKSQMLVDMHPDVCKVVWKFNRWHHNCDYSTFKKNELVKIDQTVYTSENEYGMKLINRDE